MIWIRSAVKGTSSIQTGILNPLIWVAIPIVGLILGVLCASTIQPSSPLLAILGSLTLFTVGGLVGFFFGIPRAGRGSTEGDDPSAAAAPRSEINYAPNTNLEQVSDWITKIIVGVGLIQLTHVQGALLSAGKLFGPSVAGGRLSDSAAQSLVKAMFVYFPIVGFFQGYLATRLFLSGEFKRRDTELIGTEARMVLAETAPAIPKIRDQTQSALNKASPTARRYAQRVSKLRLEELTDPEDIATWSRAQIALNRPEFAAKGYHQLVDLLPRDAQAHAEYAAALENSGADFSQVVAELLLALKYLNAQTDSLTKTSIYENLIGSLLYIDPPEGFEQAISYADKFKRTREARESDTFWFSLASAFGQQYRWVRDADAHDERLQKIRDKALDAVRRSLALNPDNKRLFRALAFSDEPGFDEDENDLQVFEHDNDFVQLLA